MQHAAERPGLKPGTTLRQGSFDGVFCDGVAAVHTQDCCAATGNLSRGCAKFARGYRSAGESF
jgi:hypothetical protein